MRLLVSEQNNLFRYLFDRYTATSGALKRKFSYETAADKTIKLGECLRFFKDHGMDASMLTQREVQGLVKMINDVMMTRHGTECLEYGGFVQLILQAAIASHRKGRFKGVTPQQCAYLSHAQMVRSALNLFREAAQKRGENIALYEAPGAMTAPGVIDQA